MPIFSDDDFEEDVPAEEEVGKNPFLPDDDEDEDEDRPIGPPMPHKRKARNVGSRAYTQWEVLGNHFAPAGETAPYLPQGIYRVEYIGQRLTLGLQETSLDDIYPSPLSDEIIGEVDNFWDRADRYKERGFSHRRGLFFAGSQGAGKTSLIHQIIRKTFDYGGIAILMDSPSSSIDMAHAVRYIEPERPIVCVYEDIDEMFDNYGERSFLSFLDGEDQIEHVLHVATSNHPNRLEGRVIRRPRRFDRVFLVDNPDETVRRLFFQSKLGDADVSRIVELTKGFSFGALAAVVIDTYCLDYNIETVIKRLKEMQKIKKLIPDGTATDVGFKTHATDP